MVFFSFVLQANATKVLIENYEELSKAAVFLEYIYHEEIDMDLKVDLEDLFYGHLSHMCEIRYILSNSKLHPVYPVAARSIRQENPPRSKTRFWRYENDLITILKYRELLDSMISQYKNM